MNRKRYVYTHGGQPCEPYEVGDEWNNTTARAQTTTEELVYGGVRATDGTPINSRKRHREYLKQHGLAMASDFSPEYQAREAARRDRAETKEIRNMVDRDVHKIFGS